jgi:hypothetical protein
MITKLTTTTALLPQDRSVLALPVAVPSHGTRLPAMQVRVPAFVTGSDADARVRIATLDRPPRGEPC